MFRTNKDKIYDNFYYDFQTPENQKKIDENIKNIVIPQLPSRKRSLKECNPQIQLKDVKIKINNDNTVNYSTNQAKFSTNQTNFSTNQSIYSTNQSKKFKFDDTKSPITPQKITVSINSDQFTGYALTEADVDTERY